VLDWLLPPLFWPSSPSPKSLSALLEGTISILETEAQPCFTFPVRSVTSVSRSTARQPARIARHLTTSAPAQIVTRRFSSTHAMSSANRNPKRLLETSPPVFPAPRKATHVLRHLSHLPGGSRNPVRCCRPGAYRPV